MIHGAKFWNSADHYYIQTNNPTEALLKVIEGKGEKRSGNLETCGPTSAVNCLSVLGYDLTVKCPGRYEPQPEEVLMDAMNDPRNAAKFEAIRGGVAHLPENRVPQFYPWAVEHVFGAKAFFEWTTQDRVIEHLKAGKAVQLCLKDPGHYIACVAYDEDSEEIVLNDPWPRAGWGFNTRMKVADFGQFEPFAVVYEKTPGI